MRTLRAASSPRRACWERDRMRGYELRLFARKQGVTGQGKDMANKYNHVAVLMGGWSAEREVSLKSGAACAGALEQAGYRVTRVDVDRDIAARLAELRPTPVSTRCTAGRRGRLHPGHPRIPRHSPTRIRACCASALAMDKARAKAVVQGGRRSGGGRRRGLRRRGRARDLLPPPYVVKPVTKDRASASSSCARITPIRPRN